MNIDSDTYSHSSGLITAQDIEDEAMEVRQAPCPHGAYSLPAERQEVNWDDSALQWRKISPGHDHNWGGGLFDKVNQRQWPLGLGSARQAATQA